MGDHKQLIDILTDILGHMDHSQGSDLKSLLMANENKETPQDEARESPEEQGLEGKLGIEGDGKPKGISIEKVSLVGKKKPGSGPGTSDPGDEEIPGLGRTDGKSGEEPEMSDDELEELLKRIT